MGNHFTKKNTAAEATSNSSDSNVSGAVISINSVDEWNRHWDSNKQSNTLMVIDFSASWCGPCRTIEPAVKAMAAKFSDVFFTKIDVDKFSELSEQWKVEAMPTFVLVKGGKELGRVVGANKKGLENKIEKLIMN